MNRNWYNTAYPVTQAVGGKRNTRFYKKLAEYENNRQWQDTFNRLVNLVINQFEWTGLPETCSPWFFEETMLFHGLACVIDDKVPLTLPCTGGGKQDLYYRPSYYTAISLGYHKRFKSLNKNNVEDFNFFARNLQESAPTIGVVCKDNYLAYPSVETIEIYTSKLVDTARAIDVCARQLKLPAIIETTPESKTSIQEAVNNIDSNLIAVFATDKITKALRESKQIPTGVQSATLTALWDNFHNVFAEFCTAFGINNLNTADKKERLISDEVNSNNHSIELNLAYRLDQRKLFCENYNKVFADKTWFKPISVDVKHQEAELTSAEGGDIGGGDE